LRELKAKWKVSIGSLIYRANKLELISPFVYRRLWTYMSSCGFRKKEPDCGLEREIPKLLITMIETQGKCTDDLPAALHITQSVFSERYPQYNPLNNRSRSVRTETT
ncbi:MAG: hypothetical protein Q4F84_04365, partial [Fibrobacter sp.]|nr:hypothetical protein [Fibrobacter sp.]